MHDYDRSKTAAWDQSVLSITPDELAEMDEDERKERLFDELNRAGDLLEALAEAFKKDLGSDRGDVSQAARDMQQLARKVR